MTQADIDNALEALWLDLETDRGVLPLIADLLVDAGRIDSADELLRYDPARRDPLTYPSWWRRSVVEEAVYDWPSPVHARSVLPDALWKTLCHSLHGMNVGIYKSYFTPALAYKDLASALTSVKMAGRVG